MKLTRLLEYDRRPIKPEYDHKEDEDSDDPLLDYIEQFGGEKIGDGQYAVAVDKPGDVNTIIKHGKIKIFPDLKTFDDPYVDFVTKLMNDRRAQDNPFLPQFYSIKFKRVREDIYSYAVEMEKLEHMLPEEELTSTITVDEALAELKNRPQSQLSQMITMLSNLINLSKEELIKAADDKFYHQHYFYVSYLWAVIQDEIGRKVHGKAGSNVKITNKRFLEAIMLLKRYFHEGMSLDIHANNVMIRRTPYGPQLVITDPYEPWNFG